MQLPANPFKRAIREGRAQIGLWAALADPYVTELLATAGFDWLLIDGEHAPNNVRSILPQLQATAPYPVHTVVRPVVGEVPLIKQYLDIGTQTLLIPMVETPAQAAEMVAATRYPPHGIRGVGSAIARASRWSAIGDYLHEADKELCVLVQAESVRAIENLDAIARTEGVDGVFFGPADLSASMGYLGKPNTPEVQKVIEDGIATVLRAGKAPGILTTDVEQARHYLELGALFVAVGTDVTLLARSARALAAAFKSGTAGAAETPSSGDVY